MQSLRPRQPALRRRREQPDLVPTRHRRRQPPRLGQATDAHRATPAGDAQDDRLPAPPRRRRVSPPPSRPGHQLALDTLPPRRPRPARTSPHHPASLRRQLRKPAMRSGQGASSPPRMPESEPPHPGALPGERRQSISRPAAARPQIFRWFSVLMPERRIDRSTRF
jgi:hypothetical protein